MVVQIRQSSNFSRARQGFYPEVYLYEPTSGLSRIWYYETRYDYVRAYFQPNPKEHYAPIFKSFRYQRKKTSLLFEDKDY